MTAQCLPEKDLLQRAMLWLRHIQMSAVFERWQCLNFGTMAIAIAIGFFAPLDWHLFRVWHAIRPQQKHLPNPRQRATLELELKLELPFFKDFSFHKSTI